MSNGPFMSERAFVQCTPHQIAAVKRRAAVADIPKVLIPALDVVLFAATI
jgi:hypothetical protein